MSAEKFLVYFVLIVVYMVYAQLADVPHQGIEYSQAIASMPAPAPELGKEVLR